MNTYIVHNSFGMFASIFSENFREGDLIIVANKHAKKLISEYSQITNEGSLIPFGGLLPGRKIIKAIATASNVYISSARHKRMAYFWPIVQALRKKIFITDEGVATINENFHGAITDSQTTITIKIISYFLSLQEDLELKTIFEKADIAESFINSCNIKKISTSKLIMKALAIRLEEVPANHEAEKQSSDETILLGSGSLLGEHLFKSLTEQEKTENVKIRDHPINGRRDDLNLSPEIYVLKNRHKIKKIIGNRSSCLILLKILFPDLEVINAIQEHEPPSKIDEIMTRLSIATIRIP